MRKIKSPWKDSGDFQCFACSPKNPNGLQMEFYEDGEDIVSFWRPKAEFQGWVKVLHGGIISTLIDEIASWVITRKLQTTGVTSQLCVRFKRPVSTDDHQLTLRARIVGQRRNLVTIHAELTDSFNKLCADGEAVYFTFNEAKAHEMGFTKCEVEDELLLF